jgi:hypothetical protein
MLDIYRAIFYLHCRAGVESSWSIEHELFGLEVDLTRKLNFIWLLLLEKETRANSYNTMQYSICFEYSKFFVSSSDDLFVYFCGQINYFLA